MLISHEFAPVVVCAADNRYAMPLAVMLRSLCDNAVKSDSITVYVLDGGISRRNRKRVESTVHGGKMNISWIKTNNAVLAEMPVFGHVSICTYYRLLVPKLLPETVTYVLYLDVDILVTGDISDLWNARRLDLALMASPHQTIVIADCFNLPAVFAHIPNPTIRKYFNAGVLGLNVAEWRREGIGKKVINFLEEKRDQVIFWDQDGLNAVLWDDWAELDEGWNMPVDLATPERISPEILVHKGILHFASACKPWHYGHEHPVVKLYFDYLDRTCWKGWRPKHPWLLDVRRKIVGKVVNKYTYGALIRKIPIVADVWIYVRSHKSKHI